MRARRGWLDGRGTLLVIVVDGAQEVERRVVSADGSRSIQVLTATPRAPRSPEAVIFAW